MSKSKNKNRIRHKSKKRQQPSEEKSHNISLKKCPYNEEHRILVVGDGDFSFSAALVARVGCGRNIVATSYDSRGGVSSKYGAQASKCISTCTKAGAKVLHSVDATQLKQHFPAQQFQRVVFNFPHTGEQRVHSNQALVQDFFSSAREILSQGAEIHVTVKMRPPYSSWGIEELAKTAGLVPFSCKPFSFADFPGYKHRTTEADAKQLDTDSREERQSIRTLIFRRSMNAPVDVHPSNDVSAVAGGHGKAAEQKKNHFKPRTTDKKAKLNVTITTKSVGKKKKGKAKKTKK